MRRSAAAALARWARRPVAYQAWGRADALSAVLEWLCTADRARLAQCDRAAVGSARAWEHEYVAREYACDADLRAELQEEGVAIDETELEQDLDWIEVAGSVFESPSIRHRSPVTPSSRSSCSTSWETRSVRS